MKKKKKEAQLLEIMAKESWHVAHEKRKWPWGVVPMEKTQDIKITDNAILSALS